MREKEVRVGSPERPPRAPGLKVGREASERSRAKDLTPKAALFVSSREQRQDGPAAGGFQPGARGPSGCLSAPLPYARRFHHWETSRWCQLSLA